MNVLGFEYNRKINKLVGITSLVGVILYIIYMIVFTRYGNFWTILYCIFESVPNIILISFLFAKKPRSLFLLFETFVFVKYIILFVPLVEALIRFFSNRISMDNPFYFFSWFLNVGYNIFMLIVLFVYDVDTSNSSRFERATVIVLPIVGVIILILNYFGNSFSGYGDSFIQLIVNLIVFLAYYAPFMVVILKEKKIVLTLPDDNKSADQNGITDDQKKQQPVYGIQKTLFCSECGKKLPKGSKFCPFCGEKNDEYDSVQMNPGLPKVKKSKKIGLEIAIIICSFVSLLTMLLVPIAQYGVTDGYLHNRYTKIYYLIFGEKASIEYASNLEGQINTLVSFILTVMILLFIVNIIFIFVKKFRLGILSSVLLIILPLKMLYHFAQYFNRQLAQNNDLFVQWIEPNVGFYMLMLLLLSILVLSCINYVKKTKC